MKRLHVIIVPLVVGLALGGWLALWHAMRAAVKMSPVSELPSPSASRPMDVWQAGIKPDTRTDYTPDPAATKRLMKKLRQEELRQRPQEGRN